MSNENKKSIIKGIAIYILAPLVVFFITRQCTEQSAVQDTQRETVELLALQFDSVDISMQYGDALREIYREYTQLKAENIDLQGIIETLESENELHLEQIIEYQNIILDLETTQLDIADEPESLTSEAHASRVVYLNNLEYFNIEHYGSSNQWYQYGVEDWNRINDMDNLSNSHENAIKFRLHGNWTGSSILKEYFLGGNYDTFSGSYSMLFQSRDSAGQTTFIVFGDGELLYQSEPIGAATLPVEFSIDISSVERLGIEVQSAEIHRDNWWMAILNPRLSSN